MPSGMTIGRLAAAAQVSVETIRYYQRRGLLDEPARLHGAYRRYPESSIKRMRFIKRAQGLGFSLAEIAILLNGNRTACCADARALAQQKLALIERKLHDLAAMRATLAEMVGLCNSRNDSRDCPIIQSLAAD